MTDQKLPEKPVETVEAVPLQAKPVEVPVKKEYTVESFTKEYNDLVTKSGFQIYAQPGFVPTTKGYEIKITLLVGPSPSKE